jgi:hypothetical protein
MLNIVECKKTVDGILKEMPDRTQEVLSRRFGIGKTNQNLVKPQTLEEVGKDFGITRERVRQIEERGLQSFQSSPKFSNLQKPLISLKRFIDGQGGLKREDILEETFAPDTMAKPYLLFILKIGNPFFFQPDSPSFYSLWKTKEDALNLADNIVNLLIRLMEKEKRVFKEEELLERGEIEIPKTLNIRLSEDYLISYIEATKKIEENPFGEYGPAWWPEIRPRGVRDRAYLVLKKEGRPLHFKELAKTIENQLQRPVQANTLHNELIKNEEFVLMGRGIYGLKEWGYKDGTVKDVIEEILRKEGGLSKEEILKEVEKQRMVKKSTILLNLQYFKKSKEDRYYV